MRFWVRMLTYWFSSQIVDKTIMEADLDHDGKISFEEFTKMVENTDVSMSMTLGELASVIADKYMLERY